MRRTYAAITALLVGLGLVVGPAGSSPAPDRSAKPASYDFLKAQVFTAPGLGQVAVGMPNERTVKVQRRTEGGTWSRPSVLFRKKGVTCGQIDGRASAGGVALMLECDTPYYEDQAPVHSMAFVTQDLVTWTGKRLRGEAYQDPAISADGSHAAWLYGAHGQYQLFSAGAGFTTGQTSFDYDSGGETVVVDDAGTVTVMGSEGTGGGCVLSVYDRPVQGPEDGYVIEGVEPGCTESGVDNVDDRTVVGSGTREHRYVVTREPGERWQLTTPPPVEAPGLVKYRGSYREVIKNVYSDARDLPLVAIGSPDREHVTVQAYDDETGTWGPATTVYDHGFGGCTATQDYPYEPRPAVHAVELHCYPTRRSDGDYPPFAHQGPAPRGKVRLLTSHDGVHWTVTILGKRPYALNRSGRLLAASGLRTTTVVSPAGTVGLPVSATGRCDFVFPIGVDAVLRLHGGRDARWPTRLQKSVAGGPWETIQTVKMPARGRCSRVQAQHDPPPSVFFLRGRGVFLSLAVKRGGHGGWHVERFSF
jgi:hypothetical protein